VIKALRFIKPITTSYEEFVKDAQEKLKDEDYEEKLKVAQQWQQDGKKSTLTEAKKIELNKYFMEYQNKVTECVKTEAEKDNELTYDKLTDDAFGKLVDSNDMKLEDINTLYEALV
jgi:hypothetical protein